MQKFFILIYFSIFRHQVRIQRYIITLSRLYTRMAFFMN